MKILTVNYIYLPGELKSHLGIINKLPLVFNLTIYYYISKNIFKLLPNLQSHKLNVW